MINILYLTYNSVLSSGILKSQVLTLLKNISISYPDEFRFVLISYERWSEYFDYQNKNRLSDELQKYGIKIIFLPKCLPPQLTSKQNNTFLKWLFNRFAALPDMTLMLLAIIGLKFRYRIQIIQPRSYIPALIIYKLKKILKFKILFDPRGIIPEELSLIHNWSPDNRAFLKWKNREKKLLSASDHVIVLSKPFEKHYQAIQPNIRTTVVPCAVDTSQFLWNLDWRNEIRTQMGWQDNLMLIYVMGHYVPYQDFEQVLSFSETFIQENPSAMLLVVSPDKDKLIQRIEKSSLHKKQWFITEASGQYLNKLLCAADCGLLMRVSSLVSVVSSPVKLGEYLAAGLPVLSMPNIGDTESIIKEYQCGYILQSEDPLHDTFQWLNSLRDTSTRMKYVKQSQTAAENELSWNHFLPLYVDIYRHLVK